MTFLAESAVENSFDKSCNNEKEINHKFSIQIWSNKLHISNKHQKTKMKENETTNYLNFGELSFIQHFEKGKARRGFK